MPLETQSISASVADYSLLPSKKRIKRKKAVSMSRLTTPKKTSEQNIYPFDASFML
jgi:hypothetical protein